MIPSFIRQIQSIRLPIAYLLLAGTVCGILTAAVPGWGIFLAIGICGALWLRKELLPAGLFLFFTTCGFFRETYDFAAWNSRNAALPSGSVHFLVVDPDAPGTAPEIEGNPVSRLLLVRRLPDGDLYRLTFPEEENRRFRFGDELRVTGYATQPVPVPVYKIRADGSKQNLSRGASTYTSYLRSRHIKGIFYAVTIDDYRSGDNRNWSLWEFLLSAPIQWRRQLCEIAQTQCNSSAKTLIGGMIFGYRSALLPLQSQTFARAGIIHVLTVSGMHVMMVAGLLLLLFRFLPLRLRYIPATLGALGYVFAVGMPVPAIRAWILFAAFAAGRVFLRQAPSCVILALTATALLLITPGLLSDAGFQYTFIVTAVLIVAAGRCRACFATYGFNEQFWGLPIAYPVRQRFYRKVRNLLSTLFLYFCACTASSIITLYHRGTFRVMTFVANLAVLFVVGPFFLLTLFKLILYPLMPTFPITVLLNALANFLFAVIEAIDVFLAPECLAVPGAAITVFLLFLLFLFICNFGKMRPMLVAGGLFLLIWVYGTWLQSSRSTVFGRIDGDDGTDTLFAASPSDGEGVIFNPPRGTAAIALLQALEELSVSRVLVAGADTQWSGTPAPISSGGLTSATLRFRQTNQQNSTLPEFSWGSLPECSVVPLPGIEYAVDRDGHWEILSKKDTVFLEYRGSRGNSRANYQRNRDGTWQLVITRPEKFPTKYSGWRRNRMGVEIYE